MDLKCAAAVHALATTWSRCGILEGARRFQVSQMACAYGLTALCVVRTRSGQCRHGRVPDGEGDADWTRVCKCYSHPRAIDASGWSSNHDACP